MTPSFTSRFDTFHPFSRLPLELRNEIWRLSLPAPRLVHVQIERGEIRIPGRTPNQRFSHVWAKKLSVPAILHTCCDARAVGLKHYELVFDTNCRPAKEDLPELHDLPAARGGRRRELVFPFEKKAMTYVDLERDYIVTRHRRIGRWPPPSGWPKDEMSDPRFRSWPVQQGQFKTETFCEVVPEKVYTRIRNFAAKIMFTLNEISNRRYGIGMAARRRILAIKDPFVKTEEGEFYIDSLGGMIGGQVPKWRKGRVRSLVDFRDLQQEVDRGTVWDWIIDQKTDEGPKKKC